MAPIEIDFRVMAYIIVGLFALVGFSRGWFREGLTTILLMVMVLMLAQPDLAKSIIAMLSKIIEALFKPFLERAENPTAITNLLDAIRGLFNVDNPYSFMLLVTGFLILFSYTLGRRALVEDKLAPLSRLLGGTLGSMNGFIVLSLAQQYLLARLGFTIPKGIVGPGSIQAAQAPQQVSMSIKNLYSPYPLSGMTLALLFVLGFVVLVFFLREVRLRRPRKK